MKPLFVLVFDLVLFVAGCGPALVRGSEQPPRPAHAAVIDVVIEEWRRTPELGWTDACDAERERIAVALVDDETMRLSRGYCATGSPTCLETWDAETNTGDAAERARRGCLLGMCVAGSVITEHSEVWPIGLAAPWRVTLVISRYLDGPTQLEGIAHEAGHWLSHCTTRFHDESHRNPLVWGRDGVVPRAQRRVAGGAR